LEKLLLPPLHAQDMVSVTVSTLVYAKEVTMELTVKVISVMVSQVNQTLFALEEVLVTISISVPVNLDTLVFHVKIQSVTASHQLTQLKYVTDTVAATLQTSVHVTKDILDNNALTRFVIA
jgi:hypothetical protein